MRLSGDSGDSGDGMVCADCGRGENPVDQHGLCPDCGAVLCEGCSPQHLCIAEDDLDESE